MSKKEKISKVTEIFLMKVYIFSIYKIKRLGMGIKPIVVGPLKRNKSKNVTSRTSYLISNKSKQKQKNFRKFYSFQLRYFDI